MIPAAISPHNLLIVDDEPAQLQTLGDIFTDEGFNVCLCATYQEALDRCREQSFAVAILDLRLRGKDGLELLQKIRKAQPGLRTIVHTAYGSFDSAKDAVNVGAFAYIEKRGDPTELIGHVHRAIKDLLSEALSQSEQRYRELLDDVGAIVWECDLPSLRFTYVSQHAESILGYPIANWLEEPEFWVNHLHLDDRERCVAFCRDCTRRGENHEFDYRSIAADGRTVWLRELVHVVMDETGAPARLRGVMFDITEKKKIEEALLSSESRYRSLVEAAPVCIHEVDLDGRLASINPSGHKMIGAEDEALVRGCDYLSFVEQTDRARIEPLMKRAYAGEPSSFEFHCLVNGKTRIFASNFIPIVGENGKVEKLMGTSEDVTDRRAAEAALRASESSLVQAQKIAQLGSWEFDLRTGQLSGSAELLRIVGLQENEPIPTFESFVGEFIHPDDREMIARSQQDAVATSYPEALEFRLLRRSDQTVCSVRAEAQIISDKHGWPQKIIGTLQDISEQKIAQSALRESEAKFRLLTERSPAMVFIARADRIVYGNPVITAVTGYSNDELLNMSVFDIVHPEYRELVADRHRRRLNGETVPDRYEIMFVTKDGEDRWIDLSAQLIDFEGVPAVLVTCVDVTERKVAQEQLREIKAKLEHVSRLSTMNEMVAGIAHEINQPLAAISNFSTACSNALKTVDYDSDLPIDSWLKQIGQQAVRCGDIIRGLRSFVNKGDQKWEWVDLNRVIRDSVTLICNDMRFQSIVIDCQLPEQSPQVYGSKVQLQQVLVNLLQNACDATDQSAQPKICVHLEMDDDGARLTVQDNGPGIEQDQRGRLFDAFFTTKPNGMGIGLAISRSIIEKHQGSLRLDPATTAGAKFRIHLPFRQQTKGVGS